MAQREIVKIDEEKCDGCGLCIVDCPEGALRIVEGKARLVKESYCDGLGACVGVCPREAITIERREAEAFDEAAVQQQMQQPARNKTAPVPSQPTILPTLQGGCPGSAVRQMRPPAAARPGLPQATSQLSQWPIQLTLVPPNAPFLQNADLLLAADCVPFALADFHARFLRGRAVLVGCSKLDNAEGYVGKLGDIFQQSYPRSLTIIHMEVPCCTGLCRIAQMAREASGKTVPIKEVTVSLDGQVIAEREW